MNVVQKQQVKLTNRWRGADNSPRGSYQDVDNEPYGFDLFGKYDFPFCLELHMIIMHLQRGSKVQWDNTSAL